MDQLDRALASGDPRAMRAALLALSSDERDVLAARLGESTVARLYARGRRAARGRTAGKVVLLHGIMGGRLEAVRGRDRDRIWLNIVRLVLGRMAELRLPLDGEPATHDVRVCGMLPEYLPAVAELATRWDVLPFAYDWRDDIDKAADALARAITSWRDGAPVHLVAHSMGGLVARRLAQLHPALWEEMKDPDSLRRGGRLVMLGTPNRGSYAITLVLSGADASVRKLERADLVHDMPTLLRIIGTFAGCYQMLPSPLGDVVDDRSRLYERAAWGTLPVHETLLARADELHRAMETVIDPERLVYVAGYDRETPHRISVKGPGTFSYLTTRAGDGRVPHELGVLDGVATRWVNESHGALQKNEAVLDGIHELLETGDTDSLERVRPVTRADADSTRWRAAAEVAPPEPVELAIVVAGAKGAAATQRMNSNTPANGIAARDAARAESVIVNEFIGASSGETARPVVQRTPAVRRRRRPVLAVQVVWGDIVKADGDVYVAGHYENVLPQHAERALDRMVSGPDADTDEDNLVITNLTRRGVLRGVLGDVYFYPWAEKGSGRRSRMVAIAGMGRAGTFGSGELRRLARNLAVAVSTLPRVRTVCSVLVGAGAGNLSAATAVEGLVGGMVSALTDLDDGTTIRTLRIVELDLFRAIEVHRVLERLAGEHADRITLQVASDVTVGEQVGALPDVPCLAMTLAAAATAAARNRTSAPGRALDTLLAILPNRQDSRRRTRDVLASYTPSSSGEVRELARRVTVSLAVATPGARPTPTRISFVQDETGIRSAALSQTAVKPERHVGLDPTLLEEAIRDLTDPDPHRVAGLARLLTQLVMPRDFRELLKADRAMIFEVDRVTARVPWEMLARDVDRDDDLPLALTTPVARQLVTAYSPSPIPDRPAAISLRALVIGDPGDPALGESLPGARDEALAVVELLRGFGVEVTARIGAAGASRDGPLLDVLPASRLEVLELLGEGGFDILHFAGHGAWDEREPDRGGWLFAGGILSSRELARIDLVPRLVVANACLSAQVAGFRATAGERSRDARESELLPGLADEFFRRGVRNYVGTAWEIDDIGAVRFARAFYTRLLGGGGGGGSIGDALLEARRQLYEHQDDFGALWAAYRHFGDPAATVTAAPTVTPPAPRPPRKRKKQKSPSSGERERRTRSTAGSATTQPSGTAKRRASTTGQPSGTPKKRVAASKQISSTAKKRTSTAKQLSGTAKRRSGATRQQSATSKKRTRRRKR